MNPPVTISICTAWDTVSPNSFPKLRPSRSLAERVASHADRIREVVVRETEARRMAAGVSRFFDFWTNQVFWL